MKYFYIILTVLFLTGCATTKLTYNAEVDKYKESTQIISGKECIYLIGPFNISKKLTIEEAIEKVIKKANDDGFYGNKLINIEVHEGIDTIILGSRQCLHIKGNLVYEERIRY